VPDLIVEVSSPATRDNDLRPKRRRYLQAGVRELWLVDPRDRSVRVVDAAGERRLHGDDTLESPLLAGFAMGVAELFAEGHPAMDSRPAATPREAH
jgi:Uma2 family endonuclease